MSVVLFSVLPQLVDVAVACTYMALKLQPWTAIVVAITGGRRRPQPWPCTAAQRPLMRLGHAPASSRAVPQPRVCHPRPRLPQC